MATITGKDGAVTLPSAGLTGKLTRWRLRSRSNHVDTTGAGDVTPERIHLTLEWEIEFEWNAPDQAGWDLHHGLAGTSTTIAVKRKSADANPYATGTGLYEEIETDAPSDGAITGRGRVISNGTALSFDTTPA